MDKNTYYWSYYKFTAATMSPCWIGGGKPGITDQLGITNNLMDLTDSEHGLVIKKTYLLLPNCIYVGLIFIFHLIFILSVTCFSQTVYLFKKQHKIQENSMKPQLQRRIPKPPFARHHVRHISRKHYSSNLTIIVFSKESSSGYTCLDIVSHMKPPKNYHCQ
jgi:hypothetical protein